MLTAEPATRPQAAGPLTIQRDHYRHSGFPYAAKQNIAADASGVRERLLLVDLTLGAAEPSSSFILCGNNAHAYAHIIFYCSLSYSIIIIILLTRQSLDSGNHSSEPTN
jgi:hypothetical protein